MMKHYSYRFCNDQLLLSVPKTSHLIVFTHQLTPFSFGYTLFLVIDCYLLSYSNIERSVLVVSNIHIPTFIPTHCMLLPPTPTVISLGHFTTSQRLLQSDRSPNVACTFEDRNCGRTSSGRSKMNELCFLALSISSAP